ncbi:hypothetical protein FKP32DRAFT_1168429 [Trametes sanguinea]|nr:hypothetical protein FKP32DRAFT_1168429 [Trametes sanguinea]
MQGASCIATQDRTRWRRGRSFKLVSRGQNVRGTYLRRDGERQTRHSSASRCTSVSLHETRSKPIRCTSSDSGVRTAILQLMAALMRGVGLLPRAYSMGMFTTMYAERDPPSCCPRARARARMALLCWRTSGRNGGCLGILVYDDRGTNDPRSSASEPEAPAGVTPMHGATKQARDVNPDLWTQACATHLSMAILGDHGCYRRSRLGSQEALDSGAQNEGRRRGSGGCSVGVSSGGVYLSGSERATDTFLRRALYLSLSRTLAQKQHKTSMDDERTHVRTPSLMAHHHHLSSAPVARETRETRALLPYMPYAATLARGSSARTATLA